MGTRIEICSQYMSHVCNGFAQGKYTIDMNQQAASRAKLVYNLIHLDLLRPITLVGNDSSKYAAFFSHDLSCCQ